MNTPVPDPDEHALDRRLRSGLTRTSSEFDARFERIRYQPQDGEAPFRALSPPLWRPLLPWAGVGAAAALLLLAWFFLHPAPEEPYAFDWMERSVYLEDPFYWDDALDSARVILDNDLIEAVVHLSYENHDL